MRLRFVKHREKTPLELVFGAEELVQSIPQATDSFTKR
jgi:hypothetical protein